MTDEVAAKRVADRINAEYIKWLHGDHSWVPGAADIAHDAFVAGFRAGHATAVEAVKGKREL